MLCVKGRCKGLGTEPCCKLTGCAWQVLDIGCGSNYLFRLTRRGGGAAAETAGSALGKLEIKWRGSLGEVGRLQTQQILGPPAPTKVCCVITVTALVDGIYAHLTLAFGTFHIMHTRIHPDDKLSLQSAV